MPTPATKSNFASLRDRILSQNGKEYWRSIEEHADTPEFREFIAEEYPHEIEEWDSSLSRRNFVKVMGASLALAGLSGCVIQPPEKIVPYVTSQEGMLPGKANFFATAMSLGGIATGLLVKSYDGRPVKIEGNPDHPGSRGATDVRAQASLLSMYDPDRSQEITYRGTPKTWEAFVSGVRAAIEENRIDGGAGIRFLTETVTSPTLIDQFRRVSGELPNSRWIQYEPVNTDTATSGAMMAFGTPVNTVYEFDRAERILSLDADIFSGFNVGYMKDYVAGKAYSHDRPDINRLYAIETTISLTGAKADHRLAVKPSEMAEVAKAVAMAVGVAGAQSTYTSNAPWIAAMAKDLLEHGGRSVVVAGDNQPAFVHAVAHAINGALGNVGQTVLYTEPLSPFADRPQIDQLRELISDIDAGRVRMLIILGGNPVYNSPADLKLNADRMSRIPMRVHLGMYQDETAEHCHWHVSEKHFLEGWGDARACDGTVSVVQPLIAPLYGGRNIHEMVQLFLRENFEKRDYDIIKEFWQGKNITAAAAPAAVVPSANTAPPHGGDVPITGPAPAHGEAPPIANSETASHTSATPATPRQSPAAEPGTSRAPTTAAQPSATPAGSPTSPSGSPRAAAATNFEDKWRKAVHDGVIPNTAAAPKAVTANLAFLTQHAVMPAGNGGVEISILPDPAVYDGRFVNNGWLQELPNPLTKITWDNVGLISPRTAARLGINTGNDAREYAGGSQGSSFITTYGGNQYSDLVNLR
ncbi:MAG: TAT-variant-translocated molybdopterin oxidoreductase [Pyrinomonadaceae bacterium]